PKKSCGSRSAPSSSTRARRTARRSRAWTSASSGSASRSGTGRRLNGSTGWGCPSTSRWKRSGSFRRTAARADPLHPTPPPAARRIALRPAAVHGLGRRRRLRRHPAAVVVRAPSAAVPVPPPVRRLAPRAGGRAVAMRRGSLLVVEVGHGHAQDAPADEVLDRLHVPFLFGRHERERVAGRLGAAGAADPVHVILWRRRDVEVDDV